MNNTEQDGLTRKEERAGKKSESKDRRKKEETVNLSVIILEEICYIVIIWGSFAFLFLRPALCSNPSSQDSCSQNCS